MKTLITITAACMLAFQLPAQIVNNSFENWNTHTEYFTGFNFFPFDTFSYSEPVDWTSSNALSAADTFGGRVNITQSTDANSGVSAISITTLAYDIVGTPLGPREMTVPGMALNGIFSFSFPSDIYLLGGLLTPDKFPGAGQPFTQRLATIKGFYKYIPVFNDSTQSMDSCVVWAMLRRGPEVIANAIFKSNATTGAYVQFSAPFEYLSCAVPDTLVVLLSASPNECGSLLTGTTRLVSGSVLLVDDLSYDTIQTGYNFPPFARNDTALTAINNPVSIAVKQNDMDCNDPDSVLTIAITTSPVNGAAIVSGSSILYTPANNFAGKDSLYYTLNDGSNTSNVALVEIFVGTIPVADFSWSFPSFPNRAQFLDQSINLPTSWVWNFGDNTGSTQKNPVHTFTQNGTYNVCLTVTNSFGTSSQVCKQVVITGNGGFTVSLDSSQTTVCSGSVITLNPFASNGISPYTYFWSSTGSQLSCNACQHPSVTLNQNSVYTVTVVDAYNFSATTSVQYSVSGTISQLSLFVTNTHIDCLNPFDTTIVTVTNGSPPYVFDWGNGSTFTGPSPAQHIYGQAREYVISVKDASNCISSVIDTVLNEGVLITFSQQVHPSCEGMSTGKLKASASGGTGPYSYLWNDGTTNDSIVNVPPQVYSVTVTDSTLCSATATYNLAPVNGWGYYVFLNATNSNCGSNGSVLSEVHGGIPPFTFSWNNGSTVQNLTQMAGGIYSVTVSDSLGCSTSGTAQVHANCVSIISGVLFIDTNSNCTLDSGEARATHLYVMATLGGNTYYSYTNGNGEYFITVPQTGTYTLTASNYYYSSCGNVTLCGNPNHTVTITSAGDSSLNNNFGYMGSGGFDLQLHPGWTRGNPGFIKTYWLLYHNVSPTPFTGSATIIFHYDPILIYQTARGPFLPVHDLVNHTLTWTVNNIPSPGFVWNDRLLVDFLVPVDIETGINVCSNFYIQPTTGDCDSSNNHLNMCDPVTGSMDPNEKKVEPAGRILEEDSVLTYTIGFQNTGNDSTHFIIIRDTLSPYLDPITVKTIASSHPYSEFGISGEGILTWIFNPLRLVDSFTNERESHGFIKFTVKKKKNLPIGSIISNKASIYFDYNEPVVTNTVADTISLPNYIFDVRGDDGVSVKAFPNPFSDATSIVVEGLNDKFNFELYDITGRLRKRIASLETARFELQRDELSAAIYFYRITAVSGKGAYGKLVVE